MSEFEPTIVGFFCNWCTYTAADLAGTSRLSYPKNVRLIRVMCTGMVDPQYIIKAFLEGADGVLVSGCHPGDCHYHEGNYKCLRRFKLIQKYVKQMGVEEKRIHLEWISASEGKQFAELATKMTEQIRELGPCKIRETMETFV